MVIIDGNHPSMNVSLTTYDRWEGLSATQHVKYTNSSQRSGESVEREYAVYTSVFNHAITDKTLCTDKELDQAI